MWKAMLVMLMKKIVTLTVATLLFVSSAALACDKTKTKETKKESSTSVDKAKKSPNASEQKGGTLLTGSYVKQNVKRHGQITDGANQVIVLDRDWIERSGASDVKQLLNRSGVH